MGILNYFSKEKNEKEKKTTKENLDQGIEKTKQGFFSKISHAVAGKSIVDEDVLDEVENALIAADVSLDTTIKIIHKLEKRVAKDKFIHTSELNKMLKEEIEILLLENNTPDVSSFDISTSSKPFVIMVVGVNGVGKTTTIGKLAYQLKKMGKKVVLGAADTFRAAAVDQLHIWAKRADVSIVSKGMGADPSSVAFDTIQSAIAQNADFAIIDTAGRLHNKVNLMNELSKTKRVMKKVLQQAPHEVMLVLDASTGQNALEQAKQFTKATEVSAITLTKLDGTAKGGVILAIADQFKIPIKFIGVGEQAEQLQMFNRKEFVASLFEGKV